MAPKVPANWSEKVEVLLGEGKKDEAEKLLQAVIKEAETRGEENLGLAAALNDLGLLYCKQGLSLKADALLQRALAIRHRVEETPVQRSNGELVPNLEALSLTGSSIRDNKSGAEAPLSGGDNADWESRDWEEDLTPPQIEKASQGGEVEPDFDELDKSNTSKPLPSSGSKPRGRGAVRFGGGSLYSDGGVGTEDSPPRESIGVSRQDEAQSWLRSESDTSRNSPNPWGVSEDRGSPLGGGEGKADDSDDWAADRPPLPSTSEMEHVLEVYGLAPSVKTMDLETLFWAYRDEGLAIKWVDDTHAVAVFRHPASARAALSSIDDSKFKLRPFAEASLFTQRLPPEDLQPPLPRPKTTARAARRLIASALNNKDVKRAVKAMSNPADERRQEADRKSKRSLTHQLRAEAWGDGYH